MNDKPTRSVEEILANCDELADRFEEMGRELYARTVRGDHRSAWVLPSAPGTEGRLDAITAVLRDPLVRSVTVTYVEGMGPAGDDSGHEYRLRDSAEEPENGGRATPFYGTEPRDLTRGEATLVDGILRHIDAQ